MLALQTNGKYGHWHHVVNVLVGQKAWKPQVRCGILRAVKEVGCI